MVYEPTTNFKDSNGVDLGKKLVTQDYVATVYPNLDSAFSGFIANPAELYSWGSGGTGIIGDNTSNISRSTPKQEITISANWGKVSTGQLTGAIKTDGTLWAWGDNSSGGVGDGTNSFRSTPRQISIAAAGGLTGWKEVQTIGQSLFAIRTDGTLWAWGNNGSGRLGDNTTSSRSTPVQISIAAAGGLTGWKQLADGGGSRIAAIRTDGTLWAWGDNSGAALGDNTTSSRSTPRQISIAAAGGLTGWKQVTISTFSSYAIRTDGTLWAWGTNGTGQIGDNTNSTRSTPVQISIAAAGGLTGWKQVSAGGNCVLAIRTDGTLWGWGNNYFGQLGINSSLNYRSTPVQEITSSTNWKQVSSGFTSSGAIKTDGTLWAWGINSNGQLGDNTTIQKSTPIQEFTSSTNWRAVSFAETFSKAIKYPLNREY